MSPSWGWVALSLLPWMLTALAARADGGARVYWGDVHGHTRFSDGTGSIDEYLTYARDVAKLDFVLVTDHDFGNAHPWRLPRETWDIIQEKVDAYTVPGEFVAVAGFEWTSQPKYWSEVGPGEESERLFPGPPMYYNHKVVCFPSPVEYVFSAKDTAYSTPDLLAAAVRAAGGLIHNAHPSDGPDGRDQFGYAWASSSVIVNTEIGPDTMFYGGKRHEVRTEQVVREFLNSGGRTGFVRGSDTHVSKPQALTAVQATALTREALFEALAHRRNYAVSNARIRLDFRIDGQSMGGEVEAVGPPCLVAEVEGTDRISEVEVIRDGETLVRTRPGTRHITLTHTDRTFAGDSYYYVRVTQTDTDEHGNHSRAWSSPIWVRAGRTGQPRG